MEPQILRRVIRMDEQGERSGCIKRADEQVAEQTAPAALANDEKRDGRSSLDLRLGASGDVAGHSEEPWTKLAIMKGRVRRRSSRIHEMPKGSRRIRRLRG